MAFVEGETLAARLERGPLKLDETLRYAMEIASALEQAHRAGIVHRDVKPGNVMLTTSGADRRAPAREAARLRPREARRAVPPPAGLTAMPTTTGRADRGRRDSRHVSVHGARAARRRGRGRPDRHLRVRRGALRDGDRPQGVRGQEPREPDLRDSARRAAPARTRIRRTRAAWIAWSAAVWRRARTIDGRRRAICSRRFAGSAMEAEHEAAAAAPRARSRIREPIAWTLRSLGRAGGVRGLALDEAAGFAGRRPIVDRAAG